MKNMLANIMALAAEKHKNQFDKGGKPYFQHVYQVMLNLHSDDEELNSIAIGHDLMEDCDVTIKDLVDIGMSMRVTDGISALTKIDGEKDEKYLERVMQNHDAIIVKMADLEHNSQITRLKGVRPKDIQRMIKYHDMFLQLKENLK